MNKNLLLTALLFITPLLTAQSPKIEYIPAKVDFSEKILDWDGFGFNYVEAAQSRNYDKNPQDYGGFKLLNKQQKEEILDLVFGDQGLQVQIVKMFLDPYHQDEPGGDFNHEKTTANMREFVEGGLELTRNYHHALWSSRLGKHAKVYRREGFGSWHD